MRRKKEEGKRKKEEGRGKKFQLFNLSTFQLGKVVKTIMVDDVETKIESEMFVATKVV